MSLAYDWSSLLDLSFEGFFATPLEQCWISINCLVLFENLQRIWKNKVYLLKGKRWWINRNRSRNIFFSNINKWIKKKHFIFNQRLKRTLGDYTKSENKKEYVKVWTSFWLCFQAAGFKVWFSPGERAPWIPPLWFSLREKSRDWRGLAINSFLGLAEVSLTLQFGTAEGP